ncbi:MAG: hypothetical protein ACRCW6_02165 [Mycoplasmoidaceae bacterium]
MKKTKKITLSLFFTILLSFSLSVTGLIYGLIRQFNQVKVEINGNNDYGIIDALISDDQISDIIIFDNGKYQFSKLNADALGIYIFDSALKYSQLPFKNVKKYCQYSLKDEINDDKNEIKFNFHLYDLNIKKNYDFLLLIKILK